MKRAFVRFAGIFVKICTLTPISEPNQPPTNFNDSGDTTGGMEGTL
jgi:hypothetical protein